jgi:hypothetical protein
VQRSFAEHDPNVPTDESTMQLYPIDGAVQDVPMEAPAFACRSTAVVVVNVSG